MLIGFFNITIGDKTFSPEEQTSNSYRLEWQTALRNAWQKCIPKCHCLADRDIPLVIKRYERKAQEFYGLAKYAYTGHTHNPKCRFHLDKPKLSGMQGYTTKVVEELEDGSFRIKLALDRKVREIGLPRIEPSPSIRSGVRQPQKRTMRLLGLLHFLFTQEKLNTWHPSMKGMRTWPVLAKHLLRQAYQIHCGSALLSEQLLIGIKVDFSKNKGDTDAAKDPQEQKGRGHESRAHIKENNDKNLSTATADNHRLVVIGLLSQYARVTNAGSKALPDLITFSQYEGLPYMKMDEYMWDFARKHYPIAWAAWKRGEDVCAIVRIEYSAPAGNSQMRKSWNVSDIALQHLTKNFIPVESSYEALVANKLVSEERNFGKPLRFDAEESELFPDFILLDTAEAKYPLEVFGRTDEAYELREAEKRRYYDKYFSGDWWCWKVSASKEPPEFPAPKS